MPESVPDRALKFLRSNLLGLIAIFIALSGVAVALPGKNKVDSGDIKQGQVKTLDLARRAVTKAKLRANAVDSSKVRRDSLTGEDIDESSLSLHLGEGVVGEREETDRERRIVIPPMALLPSSEPPLVVQDLQSIPFDPDVPREAFATTEVPLDRASGSGLQVRLFWSATQTGAVTWNVGFRSAGAGAALASGVSAGADVTATSAVANAMNETTVLDIPAPALQSGQPLALAIARRAEAPSDTLGIDALLRLVEIRYTATG